MLDVAGQGTCWLDLKTYGVKTVTAITLADRRSDKQQEIDSIRGLTVIAGDVLRGETWTHAPGPYDLIVCSPGMAISSLDHPAFYYMIFNKMYRRLAEGGLLMTQIPHFAYENKALKFLEKLNSIKTLKVKLFTICTYPALSLIKGESSPKDLKFLKKNI